MKPKIGVDDYLASGGSITELKEIPPEKPEPSGGQETDPISILRFEMASDGVELWHDRIGDGYATIPQDEGWRNVRIESSGFKAYLNRLFYRATNKGPRGTTIGDAVSTISAIAKFDSTSKTYETGLRWVHQPLDGVPILWIDLCNGKGTVVKVLPMTEDGRVQAKLVKLQDSPIRFIQPTSMRSLPEPAFEGIVPNIGDFINIDAEDLDLLWGFMVGCFTPHGGLPFLMVTAQQGSGKSMACKFIRSLLDPSEVPSRTVTCLDDIRSVVSTNAIFVLDNQSHISTEMSNYFCQISTGGGFNKKKLYTDYDESLVSGKRPIIFNGLSNMSQKPDLLSRCISIELPVLMAKIRSEQELESNWEMAKPRIFGELLTRLSRAMRDLPSIDLDNLPRLADMARWVTASENEQNKGTFVDAMLESSKGMDLKIVEEDPLACAIIRLEKIGLPPKITMSDLLGRLEDSFGNYLPRGFPDNAWKLGIKLKELAPVFQKLGWKFQGSRSSKDRFYEIASPERLSQSQNFDSNDREMTLALN